jgi:sporadic carbohydrate cluster protein (TIGR04323 family)
MIIQKSKNQKGFRGYIFSREINGNFIPQRVQNLVIKDFASRNNLFFKLSSTEYIMQDCYAMMNALLDDLKKIQGIIFYSFEMLPESKFERINFIKKVLQKKCIIFFALEEIEIKKKKDIFFVEVLIHFKRISMTNKFISNNKSLFKNNG